MKKLIAIILALLIFVASAAAESSPVTEPVRPSRDWLGSVSSGLISDLSAMSADADFLAALALPDEIAALISPTAAYEAEPSLVIYMPSDPIPAIISLFNVEAGMLPDIDTDEAESLFSQALTLYLYGLLGTEHIVLASSLTLRQYFHNEHITPAIAFYAPTAGETGDTVMISYSSHNDIVSMSACYIPMSVYLELADEESELSLRLAAANIEVSRGESEPVEISANIPDADEAWLEQSAFEVAQNMVDNAGDIKYVNLFTMGADVIDLCLDIGSINLDAATVSSITYYDAVSMEIISGISNPSPLVKKYYAPNLGSIITQTKLNAYGSTYVAACSICTARDIRTAPGSFTSCVVTIDTGCDYDVAVSFSMFDENIVTISATPIPAD